MDTRKLPMLPSYTQAFINAINENNQQFISNFQNPETFSETTKEYMVLLAAIQYRTEIMLELINKMKFGFGATSHWLRNGEYTHPREPGLPAINVPETYTTLKNALINDNDHYITSIFQLFKQHVIRSPNYFSEHGVGSFTLLDAIEKNDLEYVKFLAPILGKTLLFGERDHLAFAHAAMLHDNVEMLEIMVSKLYLSRLTPKSDHSYRSYNWESQFEDEDDNYNRYYNVPDASSNIYYDSVFLAAANHQKLKTLEWVLDKTANPREEVSEEGWLIAVEPIYLENELPRVYEMSNTRPALREYLIERVYEFICGNLRDNVAEMKIHFSINDAHAASIKLEALNRALEGNPEKLLENLLCCVARYSPIVDILIRKFTDFFVDPDDVVLKDFLEAYRYSEYTFIAKNEQFRGVLAFACVFLEVIDAPTIDNIQLAIIRLPLLPNNEAMLRVMYDFLLKEILKQDNAALFLNFKALTAQGHFAKLTLTNPKLDMNLAVEADAVNIFTALYTKYFSLVSGDAWWLSLQKICDLRPKIKAYLSKFSVNPACEHVEHFKIFSQSSVKIRDKAGKRFRAVLVEEISDASDDETYVPKQDQGQSSGPKNYQ